MSPFTQDQIIVIQGIIDGKGCKQIAYELGKTEGAIRVHLYRARKAAGVITLYQLAAVCVALGICNIDSFLAAAAPADPGQALPS